MNPKEAIETLRKERKDHHSFPTDIIGQAEQLGAEALIRLQSQRQQKVPASIPLLPSETED